MAVIYTNCTKCGVRLADWEKSYRVTSHLCHNCYGEEQQEMVLVRREDLEKAIDAFGQIHNEWIQRLRKAALEE